MISDAFERSRARWAILLALATNIAGCSAARVDPPQPADAGEEDVADGAVSDGSDASSCACTVIAPDAAQPGGAIGKVESVACLCSQVDCHTYDAAMQCPLTGPAFNNRLVLHTYAACDLLAVELHAGFDDAFEVYRASTHELVGVYRSTDTPAFTCGRTRVAVLQAGIFPTPRCEDITTTPCAADAGPD